VFPDGQSDGGQGDTVHGPDIAEGVATDRRGLAPAIALTAAAGLSVTTAAVALFASPGPTLAAAALFALVAAIALPRHARRRPRPGFGVANGITLARAGLIAVVAAFAVEPPPSEDFDWWIAAAVAGVALLLDGVDGWIARRTARSSAFGARFDMETDALAAFVLCLVLWRADRTGAWILLTGALRYLFLLAGWVFAWMRRPLPPHERRRAVCAVQGALLVLCLVPALPAIFPPILGLAALTATAASFLIDTVWLWRHRRVRL
jgi:phosphatidylglycerophosphate synthase